MTPNLASTPAQFQYLSQRRLREATLLLKAREFPGALYVAGYVVECIFKAVVAKASGGRLPSTHQTHDLIKLRSEVLRYVREEHVEAVQAVPAWSHLLRYACNNPDARTVVDFIERAKETRRCLSTYL